MIDKPTAGSSRVLPDLASAEFPQLPRARRAPRFVSKRTAMALLDLSLSGFRNWVKRGILPPPCAGAPLHEPRWSWAEIEQWLSGDRSSCRRDLFEVDAQIGRMRGPQPGQGGCKRSR
jgi:predicted DNA-binding transcriptional regulator AlpA